MTPAGWWDRIVDCMNGSIDHANCGDPTDHIRAALAERDRAWQAAFDSYVLTGTEPMCRHCSGLLRDAIDPTSCEHCQPLRALLAAGKGRTE